MAGRFFPRLLSAVRIPYDPPGVHPAIRPLVAFCWTLLLALAAPRDGITWLVFTGYAAIVWAVRSGPSRPGYAFVLGWLGGLCAGLVGFPWIGELLERFAGFPPLVSYALLFAFSAWTAVPYGLWAVTLRFFPLGSPIGLAWAAISWVALAATWPAIFPYTVAIGIAEAPVWMQAAELFGVPAVEIQVVLGGVLLGEALLVEGRKARLSRLGAAIAVPLVSAALGSWRIHVLDDEASKSAAVRFGLVQSNTPLRWGAREQKMERLWEQSARAEERGAQVIVWPEAGVYPYRIERPFLRESPDVRRRVLRRHSSPTIFGAPSRDPGALYEYNSVFLMHSSGEVRGSFDKVNLMPFGEYIPIVDPDWARSKIPTLSHNLAGAGPARFVVEPRPTEAHPNPRSFSAAVLVCYEDIFADFARRSAAQPGGIEVFVNLTIDTWFGVTDEPWEHLALAQYRSVEHRIPLVRSVSSGVTSVVDQAGRIVAYLDVTGPTLENEIPAQFLVQDVPLSRNTEQRPTVYASGGWLFAPLAQLVMAIVLGVRWWQTSRRRRAEMNARGTSAVEGE